MDTSWNDLAQDLVTLLTTYGLAVVGAIVTLIVGWIIAGWTHGAVARSLAKTERVDETLREFLASLAKYLIIAITIIAMLNQFGVETTSLVAVLGATGLAIGLALQGTLSNVAAGVMLLLFRPFKIGDFVEAGGVAGTVKAIGLFVTELATPDNVQIVAPNGLMWGQAVRNYSHHKTRRVDLVIGIAYEDNIEKALATTRDVIASEGRALAEPAPLVAVSELADSSVNLVVRVWCASADYWPVKFDLTQALKERFDAEGISIPYPQRQLHLSGPGWPAAGGSAG